jgi:signal transduction histidine kinase/ActR/RegA family two-component response regulator
MTQATGKDRNDQLATVFILAPGRDGELSCRVLGSQGRHCHRCRDAAELQEKLSQDVGALLLAEEALTAPLSLWLREWVRAQPPWSDLPVIVVAQERDRPLGAGSLAALGNVTVLTRPMAVADLTSAVASALRARRHQFQVRELLEQQREEGRRKDDFLAMLAHELRNPLTPVRYAAHGLRAESTSPRAQQLLAVVERQVAHMGSIITHLLDVSRLTRGTIVLERHALDLRELVRQCVDARRESADDRQVTLELSASEPAWVDGDATRLDQVVENLLDNAIKFSPSGGRVLLEVRAVDGWAWLEVSDEGDGIRAEDLPYLFQPFVQADRSLDRSRGGIGLGLAMVKGLVELHGGRVEVRSEGAGRGSRFRVWLPLVAAPQAEDERAPAAADGSARRTAHILLAEDNEDAADTLRMLLEVSGHKVDVAHTGPAAIAAARALAPDILLCDIGLPGASGYDVARTLRAEPSLAAMWMVAITGYGTTQDQQAAHSAGFDRHFAKPLDPAQLLAEVDRHLKARVA